MEQTTTKGLVAIHANNEKKISLFKKCLKTLGISVVGKLIDDSMYFVFPCDYETYMILEKIGFNCSMAA